MSRPAGPPPGGAFPGKPRQASASSGVRVSSTMSTIESSVTRLLVATKQLLESLTHWARGEASDHDVSDVYVNLGNEFNVACRAFLAAGIEVADLGDVPQSLRLVLEKCLSEDASQENLDRYLPSIREIIVTLLRQLKQKQAVIRQSAPSQYQQQPPPSQPLPTAPVAPSHSYPQGQPSNYPRPGHPPMQAAPPGVPRVPATQQVRYPSRQEQPNEVPVRADSQASKPNASSEHLEPQPRQQLSPPRVRRDPNPLAELQRSEALERRASRRFSAYQFAKLTSKPASPRDFVPEVPSLPEGSKRSSLLPTTVSHSGTTADYSLSPAILSPEPPQALDSQSESPVVKSPVAVPKRTSREDHEPSSEVTVFLQLGKKTKKAVIDRSQVTIASLRLLFIDKFAYTPGTDTFPEIYIQDAKSGISYELEDTGSFEDVLTGQALLSLHVDPESKKGSDAVMDQLSQDMADLKKQISDNTSTIHTFVQSSSLDNVVRRSNSITSAPDVNLRQLDSLRKDIAVVRQISKDSISGLLSQAKSLLEKSQELQSSAELVNQGAGAMRSYMETCHKQVSGDSDKLLTDVDDLQDIIEALRKDVAQRGVRYTPRQLEPVLKELQTARTNLENMNSYIDQEKPRWTKIWERELDTVCEEQQFFKLQEELMEDLQDDLAKAEETFKLVELCSEEQSKSTSRRPTQPNIATAPPGGLVHVQDAVLSEVSALQPNHERRVEAIERAEKLRKKELEFRSKEGEFAEELEEFVGESKLKKSGGVEETERRRKLREQKVLEDQLKSDNEAKALRAKERERKRAERKANKFAIPEEGQNGELPEIVEILSDTDDRAVQPDNDHASEETKHLSEEVTAAKDTDTMRDSSRISIDSEVTARPVSDSDDTGDSQDQFLEANGGDEDND